MKKELKEGNLLKVLEKGITERGGESVIVRFLQKKY